jgi:hypothetical protein
MGALHLELYGLRHGGFLVAEYRNWMRADLRTPRIRKRRVGTRFDGPEAPPRPLGAMLGLPAACRRNRSLPDEIGRVPRILPLAVVGADPAARRLVECEDATALQREPARGAPRGRRRGL